VAESDLLYHDLTREIIGASMEVHSKLGQGFLESVYEEVLAIEFDLRGVRYERQKGIDVFYKGLLAKQFVCDFLVGEKVLVEVKAIKAITSVEEAQILNYLRATGVEVGLLMNFGEQSLKYKRLVLQRQIATTD